MKCYISVLSDVCQLLVRRILNKSFRLLTAWLTIGLGINVYQVLCFKLTASPKWEKNGGSDVSEEIYII